MLGGLPGRKNPRYRGRVSKEYIHPLSYSFSSPSLLSSSPLLSSPLLSSPRLSSPLLASPSFSEGERSSTTEDSATLAPATSRSPRGHMSPSRLPGPWQRRRRRGTRARRRSASCVSRSPRCWSGSTTGGPRPSTRSHRTTHHSLRSHAYARHTPCIC